MNNLTRIAECANATDRWIEIDNCVVCFPADGEPSWLVLFRSGATIDAVDFDSFADAMDFAAVMTLPEFTILTQ
jgi:hypothetical protein